MRFICYNAEMIITAFRRKVYDCVKKIPKGRVATYGQIAMLIGNPRSARAVGNALHLNPDPVHTPCFRVVNGEGYLSGAFAFGGPDAQKKMLERDGVPVKDGRVDLSKHLWIPEPDLYTDEDAGHYDARHYE